MRYYAYCQPLFHKKSVFFLRILLKIDVSDRTDSFCRYPANCNINFWCRCSASAAIQRRRLVVRSTKSPPERSKPLSGENLIYQVRELRRNPHVVMRSARRLSELRSSSVSGGTADGGKNMRAPRPQTPRQVRVACTSAKQVCRLYKNSMVQVRCICRDPTA